MKEYAAVFSSNLVNKYGMIMPVNVLESALSQTWNLPMPSSVGHDIHRAIGYSVPRALYFEPSLVRLFGVMGRAENEEDMTVVQSVVNDSITRRNEAQNSERVAELRERLGVSLTKDARLHTQNCTAFYDEGIVEKLFPKLFENSDKHGLIDLKELTAKLPGVYEKDGILLFAHQYFRRSLSRHNTLNEPFLRRLGQMTKIEGLDVKVAIDPDLVGHPSTLQCNIELQYWWGPKFSENLGEIQLGVSKYEADESDRFFYGIERTEFWWYEQDDLKTFECEEIRDLNAPSLGKSERHFGCRFAHSIVDATTGRPVHIDGAIRMYEESLMLERVDMDIMKFGRRSTYSKIWRIDGQISIDDWKCLLSDYFRDNHLIGEYFGGVEEGEPPRAEEIEIDRRSSIHAFAPCTMKSGDGVRLSISYSTRENRSEDRIISLTERYESENGWIYYVEPCVVEIQKLLSRIDCVLPLPEETQILACEDMISVLPLIAHGGESPGNSANVTLGVIREYVIALKKSRHDRMLNFHLSVEFEDRECCFSYVGHVDDIATWLHCEEAVIPTNSNQMGAWAERAAEHLSVIFPNSSGTPPMENLIKPDGMLVVERKFLKPDEYEITDFTKYPPTISIVNCDSNRAAIAEIKNNGLVAALSFRLKSVKCSKCEVDYWGCGCVKFIDEDVFLTVTDAEFLGPFWTDRPAWNVVAVDELRLSTVQKT